MTNSFDSSTAVLLGEFTPGSAEWHEHRKGAIGGSQIGAVLGLNPWESAVTAFYKISGQLDSHIEPSMSMRLGTKLEAPILEIFCEEHPELEVFSTGTWASRSESRFHANPDALYRRADGTVGIVEVKFSRDYWAEVPKHYRAQVLWYCHVLGLTEGVLVALVGSSYKEFVIEYDQFEVDSMVAQAKRFLNNLDARIAPDWDGSESTYESVRALNPNIVDGPAVELGQLGQYLVIAKGELDDAEVKYREMQSRVLDALGNSKYGCVEDRVIVYRTQRGQGKPFLSWKKGE